MAFASRFAEKGREILYHNVKPSEVNITYDLPSEDVLIGDDFEIKVKVKNVSGTDMTQRVKLAVVNKYYTGICGAKIKQQSDEYRFEASEGIFLY